MGSAYPNLYEVKCPQKQQQNKDSNISLNSKTIVLYSSLEQTSALSTFVHFK